MSFRVKSAILALLSTTLFPSYGGPAQDPGGSVESEFLKKPSEFELERMAPRTELDMLSTNLAGENISLADGGLSFKVTDISVPTGMAISADITRTYQRLSGQNDRSPAQFGDWHLELPHIESTVVFGQVRNSPNYDPKSACSYLLNPGPIQGSLGQIIEQYEYWNGANIALGSQGGDKLLSHGGDYKTASDISVSCHTDANQNEYFLAKTPTGLTYQLDQRHLIEGFPIIKDFKSTGRSKLYYYASKVTDRFNNILFFNYSEGKLSSISAQLNGESQKKELINITFQNGVISEINSHQKQWNYHYKTTGGKPYLSQVTLPDGRNWDLKFPHFTDYAPRIEPKKDVDGPTGQSISLPQTCEYTTNTSQISPIEITHPHGAKAVFNYGLTVHGKTEVPAIHMMVSGANKPSFNINSCYATLALLSKSLFVNGTEHSWSYQFENNSKHWNIDPWLDGSQTRYYKFNDSGVAIYGNAQTKRSSCQNNSECSSIPSELGFEPFDLRKLTITQPDGSKIKHFISKRWDFTEGKTIATFLYSKDNNTISKKDVQKFVKGIYKGKSGINDLVVSTNNIPISNQVLQSKSVTIQEGDTYTTEFQSYNDYGALLTSKAYNSYSDKQRFIKNSYQHDMTNYLLNLPTTKQISSNGSNWKTVNETTYYPSNSSYAFLPYQQKVMGSVLRTYSQYHDDGNIKRIDYQGTNQYELYENYKLGKAQKVTLPCGSTNSCGTANGSTAKTVVALMNINDDGTVDSVTNFKGQTTHLRL